MAITLASAAEADRRVAGIAWAARLVDQRVRAGAKEIRLGIADGLRLAPATSSDIERLRGSARVSIVPPGHGDLAPPAPSSWSVVRNTGKLGDGLVSRWLNRPVSQRISWLLLHLPGARPIHVTLFNGLLALVIVPVLLLGEEAGLIAGGILFHAASVLDGVDGEMARASLRMSPAGAALDSIVDVATNLLFVAALTANLAMRDGDWIGWIGAWALLVGTIGLTIVGRRVQASGNPLGFDLLKRSGPVRGLGGLVYRLVQTLSGRDCYAFLFMVLIIAGLERTALSIFSAVATIWFVYVLVSLLPRPALFRGAA